MPAGAAETEDFAAAAASIPIPMKPPPPPLSPTTTMMPRHRARRRPRRGERLGQRRRGARNRPASLDDQRERGRAEHGKRNQDPADEPRRGEDSEKEDMDDFLVATAREP